MTLLVLLACTGCRGETDVVDDTDTSVTDDTDTADTEDTGTQEPCDAKPSELFPADEADDHYVRDALEVLFTQPVSEAAFTITSADGVEVDVPWEFNPSNEIAILTPILEPDTVYIWGIDVCDAQYEARFRTSEWGKPLQEDASALVDRTYVVELGDVEFTQPADLGNLLALYLDVPILIGVREMAEDTSTITLLGAQGFVDGQGVYRQRKKRSDEDGVQWWVPTWDFVDVRFDESPFFSGDATRIELMYSGAKIPVHDFHLEGTFSADMAQFGEARLWGLADTRELGSVIDDNADNPETVVCDLVESAGISCEPCPDDDEPYCLFLKGEDITAEYVPDRVLERIEEETPVN